ncbi:MAG TPA: toll/interleukin-1 receptor domain-containing protein [Bradyrhizobium sp.]|nr:toll/interleukin-1 receptor domain-containing protein [Bradyrhizobium sp.]
MGIVTGFKHDIFVSYAHFDNEVDAQGVHWVSQFQVDLQNALRQRIGSDPEIFFDTRNFEAGDHVDFLIENVRQSAIFVAMLSPSYVAREFTIRELQAYCDRAAEVRSLVTVELLPVEDESNHELLRGRKRTPFWWKDHMAHDIPLRLTSRFNAELYNERLQVLAHQLKKLLVDQRGAQRSIGEASRPPMTQQPQSKPSVVAAAAAPESKAVLLAQTTDDLYDERERIRACLEQYKIKVLPENDYPQGGQDFAAAFEADVTHSGLFVQLLGNFGSRKPPDLPQTYAQYQYETAKGAGIKVLQWRHPSLDVAAATHRDKPLLEGADVQAVGLEEFKGEILRFWAQLTKPVPAPAAALLDGGHIFINADSSDKELADALLKMLEDRKNITAARPLFEGSSKDILDDLEANLMNCEALVMLYGRAPPAWVRAQLLRYSKLERLRDAPPRVKTILVGPPAPKPELAWSGGFEKVECGEGDLAQRILGVLGGLQS